MTGRNILYFLLIIGFGQGSFFHPCMRWQESVWKEGGRKAFNAIYVAQNLGVAVGAALGGIVADYSFQLIFLANTFMYIIFLLIAVFGYKRDFNSVRLNSRILQEKSRVKRS